MRFVVMPGMVWEIGITELKLMFYFTVCRMGMKFKKLRAKDFTVTL